MAEVTTAMVKELRDLTGAGILACKNALVENDGDMEKAIDALRERGEAQAVKKSGRIAAEGIVYAEVKDDKKAAIVEVNSETDFVAKTDKFKDFVKAVNDQIFESCAADVEALKNEKLLADPSKTLGEELVSQIATIGENLSIRRFVKIESAEGIVVSYIHGGGRIGVLVEAAAANTEEVKEALKNVAMQIAALSPKYISREDVDAEYIAHETEILTTQAKNENPNKPDNIIEKMIQGRLNKELKEVCLLDQAYVKDGDLTVGKYLASVGDIKLLQFVRFETGEGIEKKSENFAEEVAKQMQ